MMRAHAAEAILWVVFSGIPGMIQPLWGPNQISAASELEMHNVLPSSPYPTGDDIREMNQGLTAGFLERTPTDKGPSQRFV